MFVAFEGMMDLFFGDHYDVRFSEWVEGSYLSARKMFVRRINPFSGICFKVFTVILSGPCAFSLLLLFIFFFCKW